MRSPITFRRQLLTVEALRELRRSLVLDPHYQRQGDVWPSGKQGLFIDSLLNGFAVPPMYWHALEAGAEYFDSTHRYAVVDGRQRLEALFRYLDGDLALSPDNGLLAMPDVDLKGMSIGRLRSELPWLYAALMRTEVEVVVIDTADVELIEELFSRLNEGVQLSAAEKRNRGRLLAPRVKSLADSHVFFAEKLRFENTRYRHYDLLAKFMQIETRDPKVGRVPNLRKAELDRLFDRLRKLEDEGEEAEAIQEIEALTTRVSDRLDKIAPLFTTKDPFLSSVGMVTIYYVLARYLDERNLPPLERSDIDRFEQLRQAAKGVDEENLTEVDQLMVEFASYAQGPTSGTYLTARLRILLRVIRDVDLDVGDEA